MLDYIDRKLMNFHVLFDLVRLEKKKYPNTYKEQKRQNRRIQILMKRAYKIPFYRARFEKANVTPEDFRCIDDLRKFPILTKEEFRAWMEEECGKEKYKHYFLDTTSGSSGIPTKILYSPREKAWNTANWLRVLIKAGYNPFLGKTMYRRDHNSVEAKNGFVQRIGILRHEFIEQFAPEDEVIDLINTYKPDLLYVNKTEFVRISLYAKQNHCTVHHPQMIIPIGEMIDDSSRHLFESVFGNNILDAFGTSETGVCMTKYAGGGKHQIHSDLFAVGVIDDNNSPAQTGRLVVTPLYKTDIPLINYVVGDYATTEFENGIPVISELEGRLSDFITHDDGQITSFFQFNDSISHCPGVIQLRLIQKTCYDLEVQAVWDEASAWNKADIEEWFQADMNSHLKKPMNIKFCWMDKIPSDKNGKLRLVINEVSGQLNK